MENHCQERIKSQERNYEMANGCNGNLEIELNGNLHQEEVPKDAIEGGQCNQRQSEGRTSEDSKIEGKTGEKAKEISTLQLFRYSDKLDVVILIPGLLFSICAGVFWPINLYVYGAVATELIQYSKYNELSSLANKTDMQVQQMASLQQYAEVYDNVRAYAFWFAMNGTGMFVCDWIALTLFTIAQESQIRRIRKLFFESVLRQEISWFDTHKSGELASRFSGDIHVIEEALGEKFLTMIKWTSSFIFCVIIAFYSSWRLALASFGFCPAIIVISMFMTKWLRSISKRESQSYAKAGAVAEEVFLSIRTVMAFNGQKKECERFNSSLSNAKSEAYKKGIASGLGMSLFNFFVYANLAVTFWYGIYLMSKGEMDGMEPGKTLTVYISIMVGSTSLGQALPTLEVLGNARGTAQKVFEIIEQKSSIDFSSKEGRKIDNLEGNIRFSNLCFRYPARPDIQVLKGLSLEVKKGQTVALVGSSGCGKSTGIQLLQRFYDLEDGQIFLDDVNINELNVNWLRQQIGVVSQEPILFATTIEENIRYGRMDITQAEIEEAAKMANAHDFIIELPQGYETLVGNRGAQLSGGQKQRIAIARALVRNPKILLLDEATSALDNESEGIVQKALERAAEGRTSIVIAHRLSTIRNADVIYAIDKGIVKESGTHEQLMAKKGLYYQLVNLQATQTTQSEEVNLENLEFTLLPHGNDLKGKEPVNYSKEFTSSSSNKHEIQNQHKTIVENDNEEKEKEDLPIAPILKILRMNRPEWCIIVLGVVLSVVWGALQPLFAIIISEFIKAMNYGEEEQVRASNILVGVVLGVAVFSGVTKMITSVAFSVAGGILTTRFRKLAFKSIVWQDAAFFDDSKNTVGTLTSRLSSDAALVHGATGAKISAAVEAFVTIVVALVIAFVYSWKLTFCILVFLPLMVATGIIFNKVLMGWGKGENKALNQAGSIFSEVVDNIRTVVSLTREQTFIDKAGEHIDVVYRSGRKKSLLNGFVYGLSNSIMFFSYGAAFTYGAYLVQYEDLEFHLVFRIFIAVIVGGMNSGRSLFMSVDFKKGQAAASRLFKIMETKPVINAEEDSGETPEKVDGDIELNTVFFRYPARPDVQILDGLTIRAKPGETLALVGTSGCGKSTIVQLIERFYDTQKGKVCIDGLDVKSLNINWLRSQIGIVSQEPVLFDTSIAENIAYGDTSRKVPMSEIIEAARSANIHSFIESLPQGYETNVGDKGTQLSGGQKQRVAIARALVRNPKILLLDEATSALDTESERIVQEALDRAQEGRTCLVIAHRLSTIKNSSKIAIIHKGQVVELGSHSELMALKGIYYKLSTHNQGKADK